LRKYGECPRGVFGKIDAGAYIVQCVILAGGLATRLRPITERVAKSMIEICGRPFLEYQLELLKGNGIRDVVICVGYLSERIEEYFKDGSEFGVKVTYSREQEGLLGTGGALKNAERLLDRAFFVMYGDSYLPVDYTEVYDYFRNSGAAACMTVFRNRSLYDKSNVVFKDGIVEVYDKENPSPAMEYIDYGLTVLSKDLLKSIPAGEVFDLAGLLRDLAGQRRLYGYEVHNRFYEIGSVRGLEDFRKYLKEGERT
jgi:NDP-sugar pyrophosphorylase family protein